MTFCLTIVTHDILSERNEQSVEDNMADIVPFASDNLVSDLRALIEETRGRVAQTVNSELVWLYWQVGARLRTEIIGEERARYGEKIIEGVAASLTAEFGRGVQQA